MKTKDLVAGYDVRSSGRRELQDAGGAIRDYRSKSGFTQAQLGEAVGLGKAQISRIESSDNLTVSTVDKLFQAMGAKAYLEIEESPEESEEFIYESVNLISAFATAHELSLRQAYTYMEAFGGLAFLKRYFKLEQSYAEAETLEHIRLICRQKGGLL